jgi:hypothetical protein
VVLQPLFHGPLTAIFTYLSLLFYYQMAHAQWHLGYATYDMLPSGRGFDTSFHYQEGAMDHFSSCNCVDGMCSAPNNGYSNEPNNTAQDEHCWGSIAKPDAAPVDDCRAKPGCTDGAHGAGPGTLLEMTGQGVADLWCTDKPCYGKNNTGEYNDLLFTQEAIRLIEANDPRVPFFMYFALQVNHSPLQVPFEYMDKFPADQSVLRPRLEPTVALTSTGTIAYEVD